jgi:predicted DNA-binding protein (MmcQ/YjbR family)
VSTESIPKAYLARARKICLSLPEATEQETWGHPTFRIRNKLFATMGADDDGSTTMSMKAAPGEQDSLLAVGHPFFRPAYVGNRGWIGVVIDEATDWDEVRELVTDSFVAIAPKTVSRTLPDRT